MGEDKVFAKVAWRIIPFMGLLYLVAFLDRVNVGFAALTMNEAIGLTPEMFGLGAGLFFFIGYFLFEVPSNVILLRVGARIWICRIMLTWGAISMAMALVQGPYSFYGLRFLLGLAEAGFAPGMLLYLTFWFPPALRARYMAYYLTAIPLAGVIGAPLSSLILESMPGVAGRCRACGMAMVVFDRGLARVDLRVRRALVFAKWAGRLQMAVGGRKKHYRREACP